MFHRKPLYVAIAQRKEDRQVQLQLQYAHQMAGLAGPSTNVIPGGYSPLYYTAPSGVVSQVPTRPGLMYQPLGLRAGWRANGFTPSARPAFQVSTLPVVSVLVQLYWIYYLWDPLLDYSTLFWLFELFLVIHTTCLLWPLKFFQQATNNQKQHRQNRGRTNGHVLQQTGAHYMQHPNQSVAPSKDSSNQQVRNRVLYYSILSIKFIYWHFMVCSIYSFMLLHLHCCVALNSWSLILIFVSTKFLFTS